MHQAFALRSTFPEATVTLRGDTLTWVGQLRPSEPSERYTVQLVYKLGRYPQVRVLDPPIVDQHDFVPHIYDTGHLCVHDEHDWSPTMLLIDTVVAWTLEWLWFWELFLATGRWFGDGAHQETPGGQPLPPLTQVPSPDNNN